MARIERIEKKVTTVEEETKACDLDPQVGGAPVEPEMNKPSQATDVLRREHGIAVRFLQSLYRTARTFPKDMQFDNFFFYDGVEVTEMFGEQCHFQKEELLYEALEKHGISRISGQEEPNETDREELIKFLGTLPKAFASYSAGDKSAAMHFFRTARVYGKILTEHMGDENQLLYSVADGVLTDEDQKELLQKFEEIELKAGHTRHVQLIRECCESKAAR